MSKFTRRHYEAIAGLLSSLPEDVNKHTIVCELSDMFDKDSERYNAELFKRKSFYNK